MAQESNARLIKLASQGQVTIPPEFLEKLGIDKNSILQMELKGSRIEITPLRLVDEDQLMREYDTSEIEAFLEEDKIDLDTAGKARDLLAG